MASAANDRRSAAEEASEQQPHSQDALSYEMLLQRIRSRRVVPFVGAGMSSPLLPGWMEILKEVAKNMGEVWTDYESEPPTIITEMLRNKAIKNKYTASKQPRQSSETDNEAPSEDGVPRDLSDEFLEVFKKCIISKCDDVEFGLHCVDVLTKGATPTKSVNNEDLKEAMRRPVALMSGPWPLIMTTNWDTLLEAAYHYQCGGFLDTKTYPLNVRDDDYPSDRHYHLSPLYERQEVRYRADVQQVFAELRAGVNPPRLLKLHGDFTKRGRPEMVAGHADYRHLMVRDVAFARLMHYICSNYSLLFFGCSLTDPDLLATLDSRVESLGGNREVGPHFWLTGDVVSDARVEFLQRHYAVYTVRPTKPQEDGTPPGKKEKDQHTKAGDLLVNACNKGWQIMAPLNFNALSFGMGSEVQGGPEVRLNIESGTSEDVQKRFMEMELFPGRSMEMELFPGRSREMELFPGRSMEMELFRGRSRERELFPGRRAEFVVCKEAVDCFLPDKEGSVPLGDIFGKVMSIVQDACIQSSNGERDEPIKATIRWCDNLHKQKQEPRNIVICLPVLSAGSGLLHSQERLSAHVSAIGLACQYMPRLPVAIILCLSTDTDAQGGRLTPLALMADIQGGRMLIGDILSRSASGHMEFTCIAQAAGDGTVLEDQRHWRCRRVVTTFKATLNDLRNRMDVMHDPNDSTGREYLINLDVTEGSIVKLDSSGVITK